MRKSIVDYMTEEDYNRYNELIAHAEELKAAAPKAPRAPKATDPEKKIALAKARVAKAQAALEAMLAAATASNDADADTEPSDNEPTFDPVEG